MCRLRLNANVDMRNQFNLIIVMLLTLVLWNQEFGWLNKNMLHVYMHSSEKDPTTNVSRPQDNAVVQSVHSFDVWEQYMHDHSQYALCRDSLPERETTRKFAVGYYSCPLQAGNRLHHFLNSLIWAVITNRTLLWKYYDKETCLKVGKGYSFDICAAANYVGDCDKILKRAEWLPSFDEWAPRLNLSSPLSLSYWTTHEANTHHRFWFNGAEMEAGRADMTDSLLVNFPQMLGQDSSILQSSRKRRKLLNSTEAQRRAELLMKYGADFLYGRLFHDSFSFQTDVSFPVIPESSREIEKSNRGSSEKHGSVTAVVHSRHSNPDDTGKNITGETRCLDEVLNGSTGFCQVMILSDRLETLQALQEYLEDHHSNCSALIAPHDKGSSFSKEHGPFSGSGFYQDLAMVSNQTLHFPTASTVFIGSKHRSSSQLVREIMTVQLQRQARFRYSFANLTTSYLDDV